MGMILSIFLPSLFFCQDLKPAIAQSKIVVRWGSCVEPSVGAPTIEK
jgi:hypothetical protein